MVGSIQPRSLKPLSLILPSAAKVNPAARPLACAASKPTARPLAAVPFTPATSGNGDCWEPITPFTPAYTPQGTASYGYVDDFAVFETPVGR